MQNSIIEKTILEYPAKYGAKLAEDFEKYANKLKNETEKEVGRFFNPNYLVYLLYHKIIY